MIGGRRPAAYRPLGPILVRCPALPVELHAQLDSRELTRWVERLLRAWSSEPLDGGGGAGTSDSEGAPSRDRRGDRADYVACAIEHASPMLAAALRQAGERGVVDDALRAALWRYLARMATRATPFGLLAAVGLGRLGAQTDLRLAGPPRVRAGLDYGALLESVGRLEEDPGILAGLRLCANPALLRRNGRVLVCDDTAVPVSAEAGLDGATSLRETPAVTAVLAAARRPCPHAELIELLRELAPESSRERLAGFLRDLVRQRVLLTSLRPAPSEPDQLGHVADQLSTAAPALADQARATALALARWSAAPPHSHDYGALLAEAQPLLAGDAGAETHPASAGREAGAATAGQRPLRLDALLALEGITLGAGVGEEAARAAAALLAMTPLAPGSSQLGGYRRAFEERYGRGQEVPLLEALDPVIGIGPLEGHSPAAPAALAAHRLRRERLLLELAAEAIRCRRRVLALDDAIVDRLSSWTPAVERLPPSLDLAVTVLADSATDVDAGHFELLVGAHVGARAAGRTFARLWPALGGVREVILAASAAENAVEPDRTTLELSFVPRDLRTANLAVHPTGEDGAVAAPDAAGHAFDDGAGAAGYGVGDRPRMLTLGALPDARAGEQVALADLVVASDGRRLSVRWPAADAEIVPVARQLLNAHYAPSPIRFLLAVAQQDVALLAGWDWGPAEALPFLPRVQLGRSILRPAQWRLPHTVPTAERTFGDWLASWRERWSLPRRIAVGHGDQRLVCDLATAGGVGELRRALAAGARRGESIAVQEAEWLERTWLEGSDGRYVVEVVVPLIRRARRPARVANGGAEAGRTQPPRTSRVGRTEGRLSSAGRADDGMLPAGRTDGRLFPPGSEWAYLKLYSLPEAHDELIAGPIATVCEAAVAQGDAERWFFVRYADPQPHLRVRLHGDRSRVTEALLPRLASLGAELVERSLVTHVTFDSYERELERYGGSAGMATVEEIFHVDSRATAALLALVLAEPGAIEREDLALRSLDDLVAALGLDVGERAAWYRANSPRSATAGRRYRERRGRCQAVLQGRLAAEPATQRLSEVLAERADALAPAIQRLRDAWHAGGLGRAPEEILASIAHMHINRLLGPSHAREAMLMGLLARTCAALANQPVISDR